MTWLGDLIGHARRNPGKVSIGVIGPNTVTDGFRVLLEQAANVKFQRVVVKGGAPLAQAVLGGHIDVMLSSAMYAVTAKDTLRTLGVASTRPFPLAPEVPTFKDQGYDLVDYVWRGIVAPRGTPPERVRHLREGLRAVAQDPDFLADMKQSGIFAEYISPEETQAFVDDFLEKHEVVLAEFRKASH